MNRISFALAVALTYPTLALAAAPCPVLPGPFVQGNVCPYLDPSMCFTADNANVIVTALAQLCTAEELREPLIDNAAQTTGDLGGAPSSPVVTGTHLSAPLPGSQGGLGQVQPACTASQHVTCNGTICSCTADVMFTWSIVDWIVAGAGTVSVATWAGGQTNGAQFQPFYPFQIVGVRLAYPDAVARNVKVSVWDDTGTLKATKTVSLAGAGAKTVLFDAPVQVTSARTYRTWTVANRVTDNSTYFKTVSSSVPGWMQGSVGPCAWVSFKVWATSDAIPTSVASTEAYPIELVIQ